MWGRFRISLLLNKSVTQKGHMYENLIRWSKLEIKNLYVFFILVCKLDLESWHERWFNRDFMAKYRSFNAETGRSTQMYKKT